MPLPPDLQTDIYRHLDYDVIGLWRNSPSGGSLASGTGAIRYFGAFGRLLWRLQNLRPVEEAKLSGQATATIEFTSGLQPQAGDSITFTLTGGGLLTPVVVTVTVPAVPIGASPFTTFQLCGLIAQGFAMNTAFTAAGFYVIADYGTGPFANNPGPVAITSILAPLAAPVFTLTSTFVGSTPPQISFTGRPPAPFISFRQVGVINNVYGYIPILNYLEAAYGGEAVNLSVIQANTTTLRSDVLDKRMEQMEYYKKLLSNFIGIERNTQRASNMTGGCNTSY